MKILSIQRCASRGVIQYVGNDGKPGAVKFCANLSDEEAKRLIPGSGDDAGIEALRKRAGELGVKGVIANMKPETLKNKIAEAEAANAGNGQG